MDRKQIKKKHQRLNNLINLIQMGKTITLWTMRMMHMKLIKMLIRANKPILSLLISRFWSSLGYSEVFKGRTLLTSLFKPATTEYLRLIV
jgi:hypothetical protein